jgi:predicted  nucleic acid-binding Zn-ribbon protein
MNQIIGFLRLQQIDTRLDQVNSRIKQILMLIEDNKAIQQLAKQKKEIEQKIGSSAQQLKLSEQAILSVQIKSQQVEANLYSGKVKNPKELQDLQAEISSLKRHYLSLENTQLQIMISMETDQNEYDLLCIKFNTTEHDSLMKNTVLIGERDSLLKEIERLDAEKKAAENSISVQDLSYYNKLRLQRGGVAVSTISEGACDSCGATLTPAQEQAVKSPEQTYCCPSCGRMLYAA